ncbi:brain tumor protein-like isoform X2 [Planococcus citri]|uniref:brain tumor protein-like isoform X2 n=1 Tax=Planococcus citri TaxID=170843 RepID=UPI0031F9AF3C
MEVKLFKELESCYVKDFTSFKMASPTPSLGSTDRTHSLNSLIDQNEYHSLSSAHSPLTASPTSLSSGGSNSGATNPMDSCGSSGNNGSSILVNGHSNNLSSSQCGLCHGTFINPKVLPCFHTFCESCLERNQEHPGKITCSRCQQECILSSRGITGLLPDFTVCKQQQDTQPQQQQQITQNNNVVVGGSNNNNNNGVVVNGCNSSEFITSTPTLTSSSSHCTSCKNLSVTAIVHCVDCNHYLCQDCMMAHQLVNFDGHRIYNLSSPDGGLDLIKDDTSSTQQNSTIGGVCGGKNGLISSGGNGGGGGDKVVPCPRHKTDYLKYFCLTCNVPICKECTVLDHPSGLHDFESLNEAGLKQLDLINQSVIDSKVKANDIRGIIKNLDHSSGKLQVQFHKAQNEVNDTFLFYRSMLEERKQEILKELESVFSAKQLSINVVGQKAQETVDKIYQTCDFIDRLMKYASITECLLFKKLLDSKLQSLMSYTPEISLQNASDLEFVSNYQAIQVGVRNTFGYVRSSGEVNVGPAKQPPIARPQNMTSNSNSFMMNSNGTVNGYATHNGTNGGGVGVSSGQLNGNGGGVSNGNGSGGGGGSLFNGLNGLLDRPYLNGLDTSSAAGMANSYDHLNGGGGGGMNANSVHHSSKRSSNNSMQSAGSLGHFSSIIGDITSSQNGCGAGNGSVVNGSAGLNPIAPYEKWSPGGGDIFQNGNDFSLNNDSMLDLTSKLLSTSIFPPKSQIKRQKMIYHCKFGEFGALEGQFTEPSGVAVNAQNDIIVADTNNHRIQIFDKEGRFKFQFGECGKRDGQLLYPNRVAVVKHTGDIIVTERSPTHQIQIYNQYGQFLRKFGATILQHPRGITVDNKGRIVVVECKVMRVIIFDQMGTVLQKFGCSKHLEFPNGVVVNDHQEIFISDNRAHCVKVFNYEGVFLRQIGSEGITNYPIGVGINAAGEILIADNHNNFNLTIFTQDGQLVSALESKVKHAQCFDVALMDDGSVVLASKDYRLYIYRYIQIPPIGL